MNKPKLTITLSCILLILTITGCSRKEGIEMPFSNEELELKQYTEVKEQLKELGFSDISFKTFGMHSTEEYNVGDVVCVYIDGDDDFSKGDVFDSDIPIVISYFVDNSIEVPLSSVDIIGLDCKEAEKIFSKAGFEEIYLYTMDGEELTEFESKIVGLVSIGFMGSAHYTEKFTKGEKFCADDWVTIYCESIKGENVDIVTDDTGYNDNNYVAKVWVTKTGSKYHSKQQCGNSDGMIQIPLSEAEDRGLSKCMRCH